MSKRLMAHHLFLYATRKQYFFYLTFLHYLCDINS
ncbi:hypothetical protein BACUNI_03724 [Bacteroides uniformis ATCC 8492]|uniref:Uncharacterized protein n=1 Tax=Bacteroides uniformis (strain ATCC 8492 / DSM 6597 / CCUG 4942 / CIP 103695 / JCM 5828 / KCTC 5204 / NCTC 13054 / VPI 0061) TaxID=411479 RepID=A0ABC9N860_BACUC|nr:hypothetical protein BACUNI_03724 [Bacteroides uniformis ATCC 8492]